MLFLIAATCVLITLVIVLLILTAVLLREVSNLKFTVLTLSPILQAVVNRQQMQEAYLQKLGNSFTEFTNMVGNLFEKLGEGFGPRYSREYRTMDGKFTARSLEELLGKIKDSGEENNYMSNDELDNLRKMFDDEDDDDNTFNQKKGKF